VGGILAAGHVSAEPVVETVAAAVRQRIRANEVAGAVALVATPDRILHFSAEGLADIEADVPMREDAMFWIASMTKPIVACAILALQEDGKLCVDDPAEKHLPQLAGLKTAGGMSGSPTLKHLLTHSSGLAEPTNAEALSAATLDQLVQFYASKPLRFLPGERWQYSQAGINALGRIVEKVSGRQLEQFLQERFFGPLGMKDTTFYPNNAQIARMAKSYCLKDGSAKLVAVPEIYDFARGERRYPAANGGLYATAADYARFCQMLLNGGTYEGKRLLTPASVAALSSVQSGDLKTGFTPGNGWGLGVGIVREPQGVTGMLCPGTYGHGGAYGTQAWIDPVKKAAYVLMVQRADYANADASRLRQDFQEAAAKILE
ncbi:MAG: serine hydrolase, partial [Kiritimatiellae bacterium]|nr:serine hydrolase [Kiritimatiellia bacterium]